MPPGGTAGIAGTSAGTLMPGPGSGGNALFGTDGSGPNVRSGSGAAAQGGPAGDGAAALAGFGAGAMTGPNGSAGGGCISPRLLPPCQPPVTAQPPVPGPAGRRSQLRPAGTLMPGDPVKDPATGSVTGPDTGCGRRCSCWPRGRAPAGRRFCRGAPEP